MNTHLYLVFRCPPLVLFYICVFLLNQFLPVANGVLRVYKPLRLYKKSLPKTRSLVICEPLRLLHISQFLLYSDPSTALTFNFCVFQVQGGFEKGIRLFQAFSSSSD